MEHVGRYWMFAAFCFLVALAILRLIFRERIALQSSLSFLGLLCLMAVVALFPQSIIWLTKSMGFALPSNFFFALAIAALAMLHVSALITISRIELRSIALTQELAILQEKVERILHETKD